MDGRLKPSPLPKSKRTDLQIGHYNGMSTLSLVAAAKANLTQRAQRQEHRGHGESEERQAEALVAAQEQKNRSKDRPKRV
jgi:hypothetical protein